MSEFLTDQNFEKFRSLIYDSSGITFSNSNRPILESRLRERLRLAKLEQVGVYFDLIKRNEDYEAHRQKGFGMKAPVIHAVRTGTFAAWMKSRGKLGGQNKVPRIINKQELLDDLRAFVAREG